VHVASAEIASASKMRIKKKQPECIHCNDEGCSFCDCKKAESVEANCEGD